jgi:hypothetical protein
VVVAVDGFLVELGMLAVMEDLAAAEEEETVVVQQDLEVLEMHHQQHHHKETLEDLVEHLPPGQ